MPNTTPPSGPSLAAVAVRLEASVHACGWGSPPLLVCLGDDPSDPEASTPLPPAAPPTDDPVADLLGYVVPEDCSGLAVVVEGAGRRLVDDDGGPWRRSLPPTPYRLAYVLHRDGRAGSAVRSQSGSVTSDEVDDGARRGPDGRLVDVCHRALGLATSPPPVDTATLWLVSWLDLLLARALGRGDPLTWADVARVHPAMTLLAEVEGTADHVGEVTADALGRMGVALGRAQPWEGLRRATAAGQWAPHGITADHAAWMDAGMYARWVVGEFLPGPLYVAELASVLDDGVMDAIRTVADAVDHR